MKLALLAAGISCLVLVADAGARQTRDAAQKASLNLNDGHLGKTDAELKAQMAHSKYVLEFFQQPEVRWRLLPRHSTCWTVPSRRLRRVCDAARIRMIGQRWLLSEAQQRWKLLHPPPSPPPAPASPGWLVDAFTCIHEHEGAWNANTGNGYYGGLQMDSGFMSTYGPEFLKQYGTADRWPPSVQIQVAIRAYVRGRGFGPWPNTRLSCGL